MALLARISNWFLEEPRAPKPTTIDPEDARAYQLALKPQGKRCALRVIAALDKLQREFEAEIGKTALGEMLRTLRKLEGSGG